MTEDVGIQSLVYIKIEAAVSGLNKTEVEIQKLGGR